MTKKDQAAFRKHLAEYTKIDRALKAPVAPMQKKPKPKPK